jgi:hypothetical protein
MEGTSTHLQGGASCIYTDAQVMPSVGICQGYTSAFGALDFISSLALFVAHRSKPKKIAPFSDKNRSKKNFCRDFLVCYLE